MTDREDPSRAARVEREVLRLIVSTDLPSREWTEIVRTLGAYVWREPDHRVLFEAIVRVRKWNVQNWREELRAQTTRMGFPDLDCQAWLAAGPVRPKRSLKRLIRKLEIVR